MVPARVASWVAPWARSPCVMAAAAQLVHGGKGIRGIRTNSAPPRKESKESGRLDGHLVARVVLKRCGFLGPGRAHIDFLPIRCQSLQRQRGMRQGMRQGPRSISRYLLLPVGTVAASLSLSAPLPHPPAHSLALSLSTPLSPFLLTRPHRPRRGATHRTKTNTVQIWGGAGPFCLG